jgi:hypothetical protein
MIEAQLVGKPVSDIASVLGSPVVVPDRPPQGDPDYGLDRYVEYPDRGFAVVVDWDDVARCVQFFAGEADQGYRRYEGALPHGLHFGSSRAEARDAMGPPAVSRDKGGLSSPLKIRPWDWFVHEGLKVHFEYQDDCDGVRMVSVMRLPE